MFLYHSRQNGPFCLFLLKKDFGTFHESFLKAFFCFFHEILLKPLYIAKQFIKIDFISFLICFKKLTLPYKLCNYLSFMSVLWITKNHSKCFKYKNWTHSILNFPHQNFLHQNFLFSRIFSIRIRRNFFVVSIILRRL